MVPPERNSQSVISSPTARLCSKKAKKEEVKPRVPAIPREGELKKPKQNGRSRDDVGKTRQMRDAKEGLVRNDFLEVTLRRDSNRRLRLTSAPLLGGWMVKINPRRSLNLNDSGCFSHLFQPPPTRLIIHISDAARRAIAICYLLFQRPRTVGGQTRGRDGNLAFLALVALCRASVFFPPPHRSNADGAQVGVPGRRGVSWSLFVLFINRLPNEKRDVLRRRSSY